jgi:hypothetical protein
LVDLSRSHDAISIGSKHHAPATIYHLRLLAHVEGRDATGLIEWQIFNQHPPSARPDQEHLGST